MTKSDLKRTIKAFDKFLEENEIRSEFYAEWASPEAFRWRGFVDKIANKKTIEAFLKSVHPNDWIGCAFDWSVTPQGDDCWTDLDMDWSEIYESYLMYKEGLNFVGAVWRKYYELEMNEKTKTI